MPTRILQGVLRKLEELYSFPNSQKAAPGEIELDLPVQPVHDMTQLSKQGSAIGPDEGWWLMSSVHNHVTAGILQTVMDPYIPSAVLQGRTFPAVVDDDLFCAWFYGMGVYQTDLSDFAYALAYVRPSTEILGPLRQLLAGVGCFPLGFFDNPLGDNEPAWPNDVRTAQTTPYPFPVPREFFTAVNWKSVAEATGTVDVTFNHMVWYGKKGQGGPTL